MVFDTTAPITFFQYNFNFSETDIGNSKKQLLFLVVVLSNLNRVSIIFSAFELFYNILKRFQKRFSSTFITF